MCAHFWPEAENSVVDTACFLQAGGDGFQLGFEFFLSRQVELIFGGENIAVGREREFNQGVVFAVAKKDAGGGGLVGQLHMPVEIIDIYPVR